MNTWKDQRVVVGIGGGIAAYKSCELVRLLVKAGATVHAVLTESAKQFVTPLTLQTLTQNPVATELFNLDPPQVPASGPAQEQKIGHIALADTATVICIAPATADLIARAAHGLANDLLTNILLATKAPVLFCPSMNVHMWEHPATQTNVHQLQNLGYHLMMPESGELACGYEGTGRLCEPPSILAELEQILQIRQRHIRIKQA